MSGDPAEPQWVVARSARLGMDRGPSPQHVRHRFTALTPATQRVMVSRQARQLDVQAIWRADRSRQQGRIAIPAHGGGTVRRSGCSWPTSTCRLVEMSRLTGNAGLKRAPGPTRRERRHPASQPLLHAWLDVVPGVNETSPHAAISSASQSWRFSSAGTCSKPRSVKGVPSKRSAGVCQSSFPWRRW